MKNKWDIKSKNTAFKNKWRRIDKWVVQTPDGKIGDYFFSVSNDVVVIVAVTDKDEIVFNFQHFISVGKKIFTLPAGYVDSGSPLAAAKKELREETGYEASRWTKLGDCFTGKWSVNKAHVYLAEGAKKKGEQELESSEDIDVKLIKKNEVGEKLRRGIFQEQICLAGLALAAKKIEL